MVHRIMKVSFQKRTKYYTYTSSIEPPLQETFKFAKLCKYLDRNPRLKSIHDNLNNDKQAMIMFNNRTLANVFNLRVNTIESVDVPKGVKIRPWKDDYAYYNY